MLTSGQDLQCARCKRIYMNGCQSPNSKLYLGKKYKKRQSYKHWENITRGDLISTGKNGKRRSHQYWEYNKRPSQKNWEKYGKRRSHEHWEKYVHTYIYIHIHTFLNIHPCIYAHMHTFMNVRPQTSRYAYAALRHRVCGAGVTRLRDQLEVMNANTQEVTDRVAQHEQYQDLLFGG